MSKPIIGVLGNLLLQQDALFISAERVYSNSTYFRAVERGGGIPLLIGVGGDEADMAQVLSICDGLLLPGGVDIDPALYGEGPHRKLGAILPEQDVCWLAALRFAKASGMPILGICRGMQLMCVEAGGSMYQDLSLVSHDVLQHEQRLRRTHAIHGVTITAGSALAQVLGTHHISTNSLHHQCVRAPGKGWLITAQADDGVIEGVESSDGLWLGVQWHPEEMPESQPCMGQLFQNLCEKAQSRRNTK